MCFLICRLTIIIVAHIIIVCQIPITHNQEYHNTLCLSSKILHEHCFQFLLGPLQVRRENKTMLIFDGG